MAGLLDYLKVAEGHKGTYHSDPSTKSQQTNIGFGVRATKEVRELRDLFLANGVDEKVIDDMLLRKSIQEHKERAKKKFNEGIRRHHTTGATTQIEFDKQPPIVQELLTELEFNGGLGGWPELMRNAKNGDYQGVEAEMDLSVEKSINKEGTKRRNRLRNEYFSEALMAEPELRLADAYGTVEQDTKKHSLWPDATMFGLPKNPIDYLFGNDRQQQEQHPQMQPTPQQAGYTGFAMEDFGTPPPLKLGEPTGEYTPEGRPLFLNNRGGKSSEYSVGVTDPKINNKALTHIPSIYDGRILNEKDAIQEVVDAGGYDRLTGRYIEPGGDPNARSMSLGNIPQHIGGATTDTSRYRQQRLPSLEEAAAIAQVQPALDPFPWLRETYDRRSKVGMYPEKKRFKGASMYPPKKMLKSRSMYPPPKK